MLSSLKMLLANPAKLFLLDGLGAVLSTILLWAWVIPFQPSIGMPLETLRIFASIAPVLAVYSLTCYRLVKNYRPYLTVIATANSAYCLATLVSLLWHRKSMTVLGTAYFLLEILVVSLLVNLEYRAARR